MNKKNPTTEELKKEVELLQEQVITTSAKLKAKIKQYDNHPAQLELNRLEGKWWFKLFNWLRL